MSGGMGEGYKPHHKQKRISGPYCTADVDEGLVDIVKSAWERGWPTFFSCQGEGSGRAYINFARPEDAIEFAKLIVARGVPHHTGRKDDVCEFSFGLTPFGWTGTVRWPQKFTHLVREALR